MASLLGYFYNRIKGSQEDIASESLVYILQRSHSAREALHTVVRSVSGLDVLDLSYSTQNVGDKLERPDISGHDTIGREVIIIEAKFWASLTDNQPGQYLTRLKENACLMFLCPSLRTRPVFEQVRKKIFDQKLKFDADETKLLIKLDHNVTLAVKSWKEIISAIRFRMNEDNDMKHVSDLDQFEGFCDAIDNNSFIPFQDEDFSPRLARRINSYYDLADKVIDALKLENRVDTVKLNATPQKYGYTRYFNMPPFKAALHIRFDYWEKVQDTPFWIKFKDNEWNQNNSIKIALKKVAQSLSVATYEDNSGELQLPIFPLREKTEDEVVTDIKHQMIDIYTKLQDFLKA